MFAPPEDDFDDDASDDEDFSGDDDDDEGLDWDELENKAKRGESHTEYCDTASD